MKSVLLLSFLFSVHAVTGKNYLEYYRDINLAERHLVEEEVDSAFFYYDKAFESNDFVFPSDAFVAAQFAWKHHNAGKTVYYLEKGAASGLKSSCLEQSRILLDFENTRDYEKVYYEMKAANTKYIAGVDQNLRQEWIARAGGQVLSPQDEDGDFEREVGRNVARIRELMKLNRYPGEMLVGPGEICSQLGNYNAFSALWHYDCCMAEMKDSLWIAVMNGQLHPRDFAALWDHEAKTGKHCPEMKRLAGSFNLHADDASISLSEANKLRARYYLCDLETDQKKKELEQTQGYRFFPGYK